MEGNKYANGKIYKLISNRTDKICIGSTASTLNVRFSKHKNSYKNYVENDGAFTTAHKLLRYDDCRIELMEDFPCNSKDELFEREGQLIRENWDNCVNKRIEKRTPRQYYIDNIEDINRSIICECGCSVVKRMIKRHKQTLKHIRLMENRNINEIDIN